MRFFVLKRKKNVYFRVFISHTVYLPKSVAEILLAATDLLVRLILAFIHVSVRSCTPSSPASDCFKKPPAAKLTDQWSATVTLTGVHATEPGTCAC